MPVLVVGDLGLWFRVLRFPRQEARFGSLTKTARNRPTLSYASPISTTALANFRTVGTSFSSQKTRQDGHLDVVDARVWRIITLKAVWVAAGESGDRFLTAILLFVSASWVISLVWICFSKSRQTEISRYYYTPAAQTQIRQINSRKSELIASSPAAQMSSFRNVISTEASLVPQSRR